MPESITLINPVLGLNPFVLIEVEDDGTDDGCTLRIQSGGGCDDVVALLMLTLDQLTGVSIEAYAQAVDRAKASRGDDDRG